MHLLQLIVFYYCICLASCFETYYDSLDPELRGQRLQLALHAIISAEKTLLTEKVANEALTNLYETAEDKNMISLFYSAEVCRKDEAVWNVEHIWPQSDLVSTRKMNSKFDLFNLRLADRFVNAHRANLPFGDDETSSPGLSYYDPETSLFRGEIARALFYMATRYGFTKTSFTRLKLTNNPTRRGEMGILKDLLRWNTEYPVSESERFLNEEVYLWYQNNRNPFIDDPTFADKIWGTDVKKSTDLVESDIALFLTAFHEKKIFTFRPFGYMKHPNRKRTKNINLRAREPSQRKKRERSWHENGCELRHSGRKSRCWPPAYCVYDPNSQTCRKRPNRSNIC